MIESAVKFKSGIDGQFDIALSPVRHCDATSAKMFFQAFPDWPWLPYGGRRAVGGCASCHVVWGRLVIAL